MTLAKSSALNNIRNSLFNIIAIIFVLKGVQYPNMQNIALVSHSVTVRLQSANCKKVTTNISNLLITIYTSYTNHSYMTLYSWNLEKKTFSRGNVLAY